MKKITLLVVSVFFALSLYAQEVNKEQWTIITKKSATWCPHCGNWGWDLFKDLIDDNADKNVIIWSAHASGDLENNGAKAFLNELGGGGQPVFYVNSDNMGVSSSNTATKRDEINLYVDDLLNFTPFAGIGLNATYDGNTLRVEGKVEFLTSLDEGEYHLAFYLLKDHVSANQSGQGSNADHRYVLSDAITPAYGKLISSGAVELGATFDLSESADIAGVDVENDEVVAILWNLRSDGKYAFFNANRSAIQLTSNTTEVATQHDLSARYNAGQVIIDIATEEANQASLTLINIQGQAVQQKQVKLSGAQSYQMDVAQLPSGTYFMRLVVANDIQTVKVVLP